jgi:hypothetical protein
MKSLLIWVGDMGCHILSYYSVRIFAQDELIKPVKNHSNEMKDQTTNIYQQLE